MIAWMRPGKYPKRVKKGVTEEQREDGKWYPIKEEQDEKPSKTEINIPDTIKTTNKAIDYLMKTYNMSNKEAINWLVNNINA